MIRFTRTGLCVAMLCSTMITGCSGSANPVAVAPPDARPFQIKTGTTPPPPDRPGILAANQLGNFNWAWSEGLARINQLGNFNWAWASGGALRVNQLGNFNRAHTE